MEQIRIEAIILDLVIEEKGKARKKQSTPDHIPPGFIETEDGISPEGYMEEAYKVDPSRRFSQHSLGTTLSVKDFDDAFIDRYGDQPDLKYAIVMRQMSTVKSATGLTKKMALRLKEFIDPSDELTRKAFFTKAKKMSTAFLKKNPIEQREDNRKNSIDRLLHNNIVFKIILEGNTIDSEKLKELLTERPKNLLGKTGKMEKSGGELVQVFDISLPAFKGIYYDERKDLFKSLATCPFAKECKKKCYAMKGNYVIYENSGLRQIRILNYLMNDWVGFQNHLLREIQYQQAVYESQGVGIEIRWHDSGDFFSPTYLEGAFKVAEDTPDILHYAYTKSISMVKSHESSKPENFVFNYSHGGTESETENENDGPMRNIIDPSDKQAITVLPPMFEDFMKNDENYIKKLDANSYDRMINMLKSSIIREYGDRLDIKNLYTYKELMNTPIDDSIKDVIIMAGDGDDGGSRRDVRISFLLEH